MVKREESFRKDWLRILCKETGNENSFFAVEKAYGTGGLNSKWWTTENQPQNMRS